jgi:DNA-directed RNA polymerase I subunit RPA43
MTNEEKQPYHTKAALEKQRVATETEMWKQAARAAGQDISIASDLPAGAPTAHSGSLILPPGRVRKTCRLDPEVRGISKEALVLITKATERFTVQLGQECVKTAHIQNRRTLLPQDVVDVCQIRECFQFLKDDIQDLHRHQQQVNADTKASSSAAATKGKGNRGATTAATVSTRPLTDYFKPAV